MDFLLNLDLVAIFKIILLDIMLGGDNAIVIAMACIALPASVRTKAILLGTLGAIAVRGMALAGADFLIHLPLLKLVAGAYLIYIGYNLISADDDDKPVEAKARLWEAIKVIIMADLIMSIDNVFAVVGAAQSAGEHSTMYAIGGVLLSIPIIIAGSQLIVRFMTRFPIIVWIGGALLGWVGAEMMITDNLVAEFISHDIHLILQILGAALVVGLAWAHENVYLKGSSQNA